VCAASLAGEKRTSNLTIRESQINALCVFPSPVGAEREGRRKLSGYQWDNGYIFHIF